MLGVYPFWGVFGSIVIFFIWISGSDLILSRRCTCCGRSSFSRVLSRSPSSRPCGNSP